MDEIAPILAPERKCTICKALVDVEDLFCANCGAEAPHDTNESQDATRETTLNFSCNNCGASMSYDASAQALRCPFCGSEKLEQKPNAKTIAPRSVVPFTINRQQVDQITRQWLGTGWLRPSDLSDAAVITKMTAVYVPYWVFTANTSTYWTADTSQTPGGARGEWFPLSGQHSSRYTGIIIGASGALTPQETYALRPFHLNAGLPPEQVDLDNVIVEQYSVPRKYARPLARQTVEHLEGQSIDERYVPGRARNIHVNTLLTGLTSEPTLLPVWIMAYQYKSTTYRFLINGQTGEPFGTKPTSYRKIALIVGAVLLAILAVLVCMGMIGGANAMNANVNTMHISRFNHSHFDYGKGNRRTLIPACVTLTAAPSARSSPAPSTTCCTNRATSTPLHFSIRMRITDGSVAPDMANRAWKSASIVTTVESSRIAASMIS